MVILSLLLSHFAHLLLSHFAHLLLSHFAHFDSNSLASNGVHTKLIASD